MTYNVNSFVHSVHGARGTNPKSTAFPKLKGYYLLENHLRTVLSSSTFTVAGFSFFIFFILLELKVGNVQIYCVWWEDVSLSRAKDRHRFQKSVSLNETKKKKKKKSVLVEYA